MYESEAQVALDFFSEFSSNVESLVENDPDASLFPNGPSVADTFYISFTDYTENISPPRVNETVVVIG